MKKSLLATAVISAATFGMANAATVYENEGFSLNLDGEISTSLTTTFAHRNSATALKFKGVSDEDVQKDKDLYSVTNFQAIGEGKLTVAPKYKINDGFEVFANVTSKFSTDPKNEDAPNIEVAPDDKKLTSNIWIDGVKVGFGGANMFGKISVSSKYGKNSNIRYDFGPMVGLSAYIAAVLPFELLDNRPATQAPKSISGYDFGLKYGLEIDKGMDLTLKFDYTSRTKDTKKKNDLNSKEYATWDHTFKLATEFEMEAMKVGASYKLGYNPAMYSEDSKSSVRKPMKHTLGLEFEMGLYEGLGLETGLEFVMNEAANAGDKVTWNKDIKNKSKAEAETEVNFNLGLTYEFVEGFKAGAKIETATKMYSAALDMDGKAVKDDMVTTTSTEPKFILSLGYEF